MKLLTNRFCLGIRTLFGVQYLSNEWLAAADAAVRSASGSAPAEGITIDQHITDRVDYRVVVERDACSITALTAEPTDAAADASFTQDAATAAAVAQGTTDAHQAFLLGRIRFEGNIDVLIERRDAFEWLAGALAPVLAETSFD